MVEERKEEEIHALAQGYFEDARRALAGGDPARAAGLFGKVVEIEPIRNWAWLWMGKALYEAGDYDGAVRANQKAASGLSAWADDGVAMRRYVAWGMGPEPLADEVTWRKHAEEIGDRARAMIELHTASLRTLGRSQEQLQRLGSREAAQ